jgi:hypothetical protein
MKYYEFTIIPERKLIKEKNFGLWTREVATQYYKDYKEAVKSLLGKPWAELVDLSEWKVSEQEVVKIVGRHLKWSKENGLQASANIIPGPLERLQARRMLQEGGITDMSEIFETEKEALEWLRSRGF